MKLAVMQPYFFPFIGYWQLINAVDCFVLYDDVNYIKRGWINRNRILISGKPTYLTIPLIKASQNKRINDILVQPLPGWRTKMLKSIDNTYRKAPFFEDIFPVIERTVCFQTDSLTSYLAMQIKILATLLNITTKLITSSTIYNNNNLNGQARILDICRQENASVYINSAGGRALYDMASFQQQGINLQFIEYQVTTYPQRVPGFISHLSIIDALFEIGVTEVKSHLDNFTLSTETAPNALK